MKKDRNVFRVISIQYLSIS